MSEIGTPIPTTQSRWRSPYLWVSIASIVAFILANYGLYDLIGLNAESFRTLINLLLGAAATLGVINNPTDPINW